VRDNTGNSLPDSSVVTFAENHDTGKEHDKWITKDFKMAYAYMLTHQAKPCIFYPHYYGVTQKDNHDTSITVAAPASLKADINKLINIRKTYLGGSLTVLSETGNPYPSADTYNVYVVRRQGNGTKAGAIIVLNNHDSNIKGLWVDASPAGYENLAGQTLVNALNGTETTYVYPDGRAYFPAPARGYSIWVKQSDYVTMAKPNQVQVVVSASVKPAEDADTPALNFTANPNPTTDFVRINVPGKDDNRVKIFVIDATGRTVSELHNGTLSKGNNSLLWNCSAFPAGIYFCVANMGRKIYKKKIVVAK